MSRMCSKCGVNPPRTPRAAICSECAKLGGRAPVDPEAVAAAVQHDEEAASTGTAYARPNITKNQRMREAIQRAAEKKDKQE